MNFVQDYVINNRWPIALMKKGINFFSPYHILIQALHNTVKIRDSAPSPRRYSPLKK